MLPSLRRISAAVAGLALVTAPSAVLSHGAVASAESAAVPISTVAEPKAAFRRPADVLRARQQLRAGAAVPSVARPAGTSTATSRRPDPFRFLAVLDGRPVRWNPCAPIRWTANVSGGPAGGLAVLQQAVSRIAAVTGTTWHFVGTSATVPTTAYLPGQAQVVYPPVLLGWTDGASSDLLAGQASQVLGMARTAWFGSQSADGTRRAATRTAVVALDRTERLALRGPNSWHAVALHELGHVMGLDHSEGPGQLMSSTLPAVADFQPGDRVGLVALGRQAGCVTVP